MHAKKIFLLLFVTVNLLGVRSSVFFKNDTDYDVKFTDITSDRDAFKGRDYWLRAMWIPPWRQRKILLLKRTRLPQFTTIRISLQGHFEKDGQQVGDTFVVHHELRAALGFGDFKFGVNDLLYERPELQKSAVTRAEGVVSIENKPHDIIFQSFPKESGTICFHDVEYVLMYPPRKKWIEDNRPEVLDVISANLCLVPRIAKPGEGQVPRAKRFFRNFLANISFFPDVFVLSEVLDVKSYKKIKKRARKYGFPYQTPVLAESSNSIGNVAISLVEAAYEWAESQVSGTPFQYPVLSSGGVMLVSRHPIVCIEEQTFGRELCSSYDCLADKGVLYAAINKGGKIYHIIATHLESKDRALRKRQLEKVKQFIKDRYIPRNEPIVLVGDLNVDKDSQEYQEMLEILDVAPVTSRGFPWTVDRTLGNPFAKPQGAGNLYLDYVLSNNSHEQPLHEFNHVFRAKMKYGRWALETLHTNFEGGHEFSDHYPVWGHFEYAAA